MMKKIIVGFTLCAFYSSSFAQNFYNPSVPLNYVANNAVNQMMNTVTNTLARSGEAITSAASLIARANVARAALAVAGVGTAGLIAYGAGYYVGTLINRSDFSLSLNADGSFSWTGFNTVPATTGFNKGEQGWMGQGTSLYGLYAKDPSVLALQYANIKGYTVGTCEQSTYNYSCSFRYASGTNAGKCIDANCSQYLVAAASGLPASCPAGNMYNGTTTSCVADGKGTRQDPVSGTATPAQLPTIIPPSVLDKPLTHEEESAIQTGVLGGIRNYYPVPANPIPADVPTPAKPTTLGDYVRPISTPGEVTPTTVMPQTGSLPTTTTVPASTTTTTTTDTATGTTTINVKVDLGADPGIGAPTFEPDIPSANSILDPFLNLMPDLRNPNFTGPSGSCQFGTPMTILGKQMSFKLACDLLDQNAGTIRAAMTAFFLILAVIIVLGA